MKQYPWTFLFGICCFGIPLSAQSGFFNAFAEADKVWEQNEDNYYAPIHFLQGIAEDSLSKFEKNIYYDALATYHSINSNFEASLRYDSQRRSQRKYGGKRTVDSTFIHTKMSLAKQEILHVAEEFEVIMINESHHTPYHRQLVSELLRELRQLGFNYLALEGLSREHQVNERRYPCFEDGFYTREPLFGELIRQAVQLDYTLVAYEAAEKCKPEGKDKYHCQRFRDSIQAKNIYDIKKKDVGAKMLVLAGYSHIKKNSQPHKTRMAEYFARLSGIQPLSIDQTTMMDFADTNFLNPNYAYVQDHLPAEPVVFLNADGTIWRHSKRVDITVFSPPLTQTDHRYSFYQLRGQVKYVPKVNHDGAFLIQAFYAQERGHTIPADQFFRTEEEKCLYVYPGIYRIQFRDKRGALLSETVAEIK